MAVAQPAQPVGLLPWGDIALHRRGVGTNLTRRSAQQLTNRLAFQLAAKIPKRGIQAANGAAQIGSGELVLALGDHVDQIVDVERVLAQRIGRDLAVQNLRRDVGVVGRDLPPALAALIGADPNEADKLIGEGFDTGDFHNVLGL